MYIESILALQAKAGGSAQLPLAIMTSGDTHARTEQLLKDNASFGMQLGQVTLLKQEKVRAPKPLTQRPYHPRYGAPTAGEAAALAHSTCIGTEEPSVEAKHSAKHSTKSLARWRA